jgi:hypothetical protein
LRKLG